MTVNIVMLCYNRHMLMHQALRTLYRNTPLDAFNLTVVDDESAVQPKPIRREHQANFTSVRIENSKHITGMARNLGVYFAEKYWGRGDYLYLSDNDVYFTPGWLEQLLHMIESTSIAVFGGWNHQYMQPTYSVNHCFATHDAITGASQLMRWETWDKYGPLDAHTQGVCQGEDWQFCQNIIKDGGSVGSIYPRVIYNCGLTNSYGKPSVGADLVLAELKEAKKIYPDLFYE